MLYFDHNATTPMLAEARAAWLEAVEQYPGNPSSPHRLGQRAAAALEAARLHLARLLGADPLEIIWTSGATESNNMVFHHVARSASPEDEAWVSAIEHPSVLRAAAHYFGARLRLIPVTRDGLVDLGWLEERLRERRPVLVSVMAANNETGVLQPWRQALELCRGHGVMFFCDASQWLGKLPARDLGAAGFVSGCAHKFGGPQGAGFLKCPGPGGVGPLLFGGSQEEGRRAGTTHLAGVLSMIAALRARETALAAGEHQARLGWRTEFETQLLAQVPGTEVVGRSVDRLWNTVAALLPAVGLQRRWVVKLDRMGFAVSTGSACASGREQPSPVLAAMGYEPEKADRLLRFSSGWETTEADWRALLGGVVTARAALQVDPPEGLPLTCPL